AGWLICGALSAAEAGAWSMRGFEVVCGSVPEMLTAMREIGRTQLRTRRPWGRQRFADSPARKAARREAPRQPGSPYKRLDYFERADWQRFFGREPEIQRLVDLVAAHRLVVMTGPSGTGKTSLLKAGLLAWCDRNLPFTGIYARCGEDPEKSMIAAVRSSLKVSHHIAAGD